MLPGFKFLVATIFLSISVLIFGLGAAALLRSAHDEFVSIPSWRAAQQPMLAPVLEARLETPRLDSSRLDSSRLETPRLETPRLDTTRPTLSLLRAEPPVAAPVESTAKSDDAKIASIDPQTATDKNADVANTESAEAGKPVVKKLRRTRNAAKRKRFATRARATVAVQQQSPSSDPFAGFGASVPLANPPRR